MTIDNTTIRPIIVASGDIASGNNQNDEETARQLDAILASPNTAIVAALGDVVYEEGTPQQFANYYDPTWGRHAAATKPAVGNHEYRTPGASGYYDYWASKGVEAGDPAEGWYSYEVGQWKIVVLNTNCTQVGGCGLGSPQNDWLRAELAASSQQCTLAYWHHPLFVSEASGNPTVKPLWQALDEFEVEAVLVGHVHYYERFAPQTAAGTPDPNGVRQFTVGTGGRTLHPFNDPPLETSEYRDRSQYGVLLIELVPDGYSWEFLPVGGGPALDSGVDVCH